MCLWIENIIPKVADNDIVCYKVCKRDTDGNYISLFKGYKYKVAKEYNNNIPISNNAYFYRLFMDTSGLNFLCYDALGPNLFHSYKIKHCPGFNSPEVGLECIIPKGAYYWEDKNCYGSSQIIIMGEI